MVASVEFTDLMTRLRGGDDEAAAEVFARFVRRLVALTSNQFDTWFRRKVDPEGIVQSAYKSFFVRQRRGQFELDDWESLWGLLVVITLRKCNRRREYLMAERRDPGREVAAPADGWDGSWAFVDREPSPFEAAVLSEMVTGLLDSLDRPSREIAELSLQGCTAQEIAARLGRSLRTVQRVRGRLKDRLDRVRAEDAAEPQPLGSQGGS